MMTNNDITLSVAILHSNLYRPKMTLLNVYLAKSRMAASQRAHFAIVITSPADTHNDLSRDFRSVSWKGTVIHVIGEPVMNGYVHEFKRNFTYSASQDLQEMVYLGQVDAVQVYLAADGKLIRENTPRSGIEREAITIRPPPGGQNVRAPIDGVGDPVADTGGLLIKPKVRTWRCQEWTMEFLRRLADKGLIGAEAVGIAESQRDPPTHGIFGQR